MKTDATLRTTLLERLNAAPSDDAAWTLLVLAALDGPQALEAALRNTATKSETKVAVPPPKPAGAYLKSITVEGFRGIGKKTPLPITTGPGLTLVVGRNGSGKSSFAEALELLLTGNTFRWKNRTAVWREGWRNLHHKDAHVAAELLIEGEKGACEVTMRWKDGAELDDCETACQPHGKPKTDLASLGWSHALVAYRPFLSYSELGSMLDEGPSKLYDALSAILGLEELTTTLETLAEARKSREKAQKEAGDSKKQVQTLLAGLDDPRAREFEAAIQKKDGLDEAAAILANTRNESQDPIALLKKIADLDVPSEEATAAVAAALRAARKKVSDTAGTLAAKSKDLAAILDQALHFHQNHGDGDCPVCGNKSALTAKWQESRAAEIAKLRDQAKDADDAQKAADTSRNAANNLRVPQSDLLDKAGDLGLDAAATRAALDAWSKAFDHSALNQQADALEKAAPLLRAAAQTLKDQAKAIVKQKEEAWTPAVTQLAAWLKKAKDAHEHAQALPSLKKAEKWLKDEGAAIRQARFQPLADKAQDIWSRLRQQSHVSLGGIRLQGEGNKRRVDLDVTVDGSGAQALGVMSQGELNALALALFIPRATLPESPFRFLVIDDPVQSMDPARVDGLAKVLELAAKDRQVVVFTHDDRLPEAVRRLTIPAIVIEVTRREGSAVELRRTKDPVSRYLDDAMSVAQTDGLPSQAARRVIPGLCRLAVEAACTEVIRRRRLARGESHAAVEELLTDLSGTKPLAALALFDDEKRASDVMPRLDKERKDFADVYRMVNEGSHVELPGPPIDLVHSAKKLAAWLQALR